MALSAADTNKWATLLEKRDRASELKTTAVEHERTGPMRQRQRRLTENQVEQMAARYHEGATLYELAVEFGCNRATVAGRLKKAGISLRLQSPTSEEVDQMVILYESRLSLQKVGMRLGFSSGTVQSRLRDRNVWTRDTHERTR